MSIRDIAGKADSKAFGIVHRLLGEHSSYETDLQKRRDDYRKVVHNLSDEEISKIPLRDLPGDVPGLLKRWMNGYMQQNDLKRKQEERREQEESNAVLVQASHHPDTPKGIQPSRSENSLDVMQLIGDAVGVADPTSVVDGVNTVVSLGRALFDRSDRRGEHLKNAAISATSMLPFGDFAKMAKMRSAGNTIQSAASYASTPMPSRSAPSSSTKRSLPPGFKPIKISRPAPSPVSRKPSSQTDGPNAVRPNWHKANSPLPLPPAPSPVSRNDGSTVRSEPKQQSQRTSSQAAQQQPQSILQRINQWFAANRESSGSARSSGGSASRNDAPSPQPGKGQSAGGETRLDVMQLIGDAIGVVDPTSIVDGLNAVTSLTRAMFNRDGRRGEHLVNAGISAVSMIPFGDIAKVGKVRTAGRVAQTLVRGSDGARISRRSAANIAGRASGRMTPRSDMPKLGYGAFGRSPDPRSINQSSPDTPQNRWRTRSDQPETRFDRVVRNVMGEGSGSSRHPADSAGQRGSGSSNGGSNGRSSGGGNQGGSGGNGRGGGSLPPGSDDDDRRRPWIQRIGNGIRGFIQRRGSGGGAGGSILDRAADTVIKNASKPVGMFAIGLTAAAAGMTAFIRGMNRATDSFLSAHSRLQSVNAEIAMAEAKREIAGINRDIKKGRELGSVYARSAEANIALEDVRERFSTPLKRISGSISSTVTKEFAENAELLNNLTGLSAALNAVASVVESGTETVSNASDAIRNVIEKMFPWAKSDKKDEMTVGAHGLFEDIADGKLDGKSEAGNFFTEDGKIK